MTDGNSATANDSRTAGAELVIDRVFDAPRELVWKMWTERMGEWSAPRGFTIPVSEGDLRPGGAWRACMRKPDGKDLWLGGVYREIVAPERLVFTHAWDNAEGSPGPETVVIVVLVDLGDKTAMHFTQTGFASAGEREGHAEGWGECFDILDEVLRAGKSKS